MIIKYLFILLFHLSVLTFAQTVNIVGKELKIGMDKSLALNSMYEF